MSIKLSKLMAARQVIEDDDIRQEVELIRAQERRYVNPAQPIHAPVDNQAGRQRADQNAPAARPAPVAIPPRDPDHVVAPPPGDLDQDVALPPGPADQPRPADQPGPGPGPAHDQPGPAPRPALDQHGPAPRPAPDRPGPAPSPASDQPGSPQRREAGRADPAQPQPNHRDEIAAGLSSDDEVNNEPPRRRQRLSDLIRENNELYNDFMKRTVPRLLRDYGIDLDD